MPADIEELRKKDRELRARMTTATMDELPVLVREVSALNEWMVNVEAGAPCCRDCGSTSIVAWYSVTEGQGIEMCRNEEGVLRYEYDGDTDTGEAGPDEQFYCRDCGLIANTLEYLVGDTDEDRSGYVWEGWSEGESDCEPPEPGKRWLTIRDMDGNEIAVVVHRLTGRDDDAEMSRKTALAERIVAALNAKGD